MNAILDVVMRNIDQLNKTMLIMQTSIDNHIASNDLTLKAINGTLQSNYQNIDRLNETMMVMQTNIASNDVTLKVINETLQYNVKAPMVIIVPNSDEINDHRSKFSKMLRTTVV